MQVVELEIGKIVPYQNNPRAHSDEQVNRIAASIAEFGFNQPIVIDENNIVLVGHGRLEAAKKINRKTAPTIQLKSLTEAQKKAYRIIDNKLQNDSTWQIEDLNIELSSLEDLGFDLELYGLDDLKLEVEPEVKDDEFEAPDEIQTNIKLGDVIELGPHRVMCGDSTSADDVAKLMNSNIGVLFNTDPPYGIAYVANAKSKGQSLTYEDIENDELDGEHLQEFLENAIRAYLPHLKSNCAYYLWHPMLTQGTFFAAAAAADILINRQIIWVKPSFIFGRGDYHWKHELAFYGWVKGNKPDFYGERNQDTVWVIGRENDKIHPTQKPLELFSIPIKNHTRVGEVVVEPFLGSGSQLIAADQLGRICYGMEVEPRYCQVIVDRYRKYCLANNKEPVIKINGVTV